MANAQQDYTRYQRMLAQSLEANTALALVCGQLHLDKSKQALEDAAEEVKSKTFTVGIMGEFRRGKSTVINALLGKNIVPSDIVPTSATLNYIRWGQTPSAVIHFKDGSSKNIDVSDISGYVTKITAESERVAETVEDSVVYYPCIFCENNVQIVDTPGLNDNDRMTEIAERVIPTLDAMIFVMVHDAPFSASEADFLRSKIMTSDLGRIIFVVNKIDTLKTDAERTRILDYIKSQIKKNILGKFEEMYGADSDELANAKIKIGEIQLIGVSAQQALKGRMQLEASLISESNFLTLESALSRLLTEERGIVVLSSLLHKMNTTIKESNSAIAMKLAALQMDETQLAEVTQKSKVEAQKSREMAEQKISELRGKAKSLYDELLPEIAEIYESVGKSAVKYAQEVSISPSDVNNSAKAKNKAAEIAKNINTEISKQLAASTEVLSKKIQQAVSQDVADFGKSIEDILSGIEDVQKEMMPKSDWGVVVVDSVAALGIGLVGGSLLFGMGGLISGFKANGIQGAALGLVSGGAMGYLAMQIVGTVGFSIIGAPVILPVLAVGGIVSTFGGQAVVNKVFSRSIGQKNIAKIREQLLNSVAKAMESIRAQHVLENWLRTSTKDAYTVVADKIEQELATVITDFEKTMAQIKFDHEKKRGNIAGARHDLEEMSEQLKKIAEKIAPLQQQLMGKLN